MGAYASAKRRLFEMLPHDAVAVINADDPLGASFADASTAPVVTFGIDAVSSDVRADIVQMDGCGTQLVVHGRQNRYELRTSLVGKHNVSNLLAAAATAEALGVAPHAIRDGSTRFRRAGRLQRVSRTAHRFRCSSLPHRRCLATCCARPITTGRLICVFGCGGDRDRTSVHEWPPPSACRYCLRDQRQSADRRRERNHPPVPRGLRVGLVAESRWMPIVSGHLRSRRRSASGDMILIAGRATKPTSLSVIACYL